MKILNNYLSRLIEWVAGIKLFLIAKAGKTQARRSAIDSPEGGQIRRLGFMTGQIAVPDDFDTMGSAEIERLFGGEAGD